MYFYYLNFICLCVCEILFNIIHTYILNYFNMNLLYERYECEYVKQLFIYIF